MQEIDKSNIIRDKLVKSQTSPLKMYRELTAGNVSFGKFLYYEIVTSILRTNAGWTRIFSQEEILSKII